MSSPSTERRRRRKIVLLFSIFFVGVIVLHIRNRIVDRHAWPEPLPQGAGGLPPASAGVRGPAKPPSVVPEAPGALPPASAGVRGPARPPAFVSSPPPRPECAATARALSSNAWSLLSRLSLPFESKPDIRAAAMKELPSFVLHGFASTNAYPAIEAWTALLEPSLPLWEEASALPASWATFEDDPNAAYAVLGQVVEMSRFTPYLAARARRDGEPDRCLALWLAALRNGAHATHGMGTAGQVVAFDVTTTTVRDILRTPPDLLATFEPTLSPALLALETATAPLSESIYFDGIIARRALDAFFSDGTDLPPGTQKPSGFYTWLSRRLGSSPEVSHAHLDAIVSRVIQAADAPYTAQGLYADLPDWCRGKRPPWTNDPAAALAVCAFRDNTLAAGVYPVLRLTELRAAQAALQLSTQQWQASGPSSSAPRPECAAAVSHSSAPRPECAATARALPIDPFSPTSAPFVLDAPPPAWRFHSVGPDQVDNGGTNDWASAQKAAPGLDLLYSAP